MFPQTRVIGTTIDKIKRNMRYKWMLLIVPSMVFIVPSSYAQLRYIYGEPFDSLYKQAVAAEEAEDYSLALARYDAAFGAFGDDFPTAPIYTSAFYVAYNSGEWDKAIFYLDKYTNDCIVNEKEYRLLIGAEKFTPLRNHPQWHTILLKIDSKRKAYGEVYEELLHIGARDQALRQMMKCAEEKLKDSLQIRYFYELMNQEDSLNLLAVEAIIEKHGWLGNYQVGKDGNRILMQVIQHNDLATQEKYLPLIRASVEQGQTDAASLAFLEDRIRLYQGRYQIYGTQVIKDGEIYRVFPIEDPDQVDARRAKLHFEPLVEYLNFFDIKINSPDELQLDYLLERWTE